MQKHPDENTAKNAANYVHDECSFIANELVKRATAKGYNVVIDGTGSNPVKVKKQVEDAHKAGYTVKAHYVNTPLETALDNNRKRFYKDDIEDRRWVPESVLKEAHKSVSKNWDSVSKLFDDVELLYNDGKNTPKVLAFRDKSGNMKVQDQKLYKEFIDKGDD
jgi:predicted kinase